MPPTTKVRSSRGWEAETTYGSDSSGISATMAAVAEWIISFVPNCPTVWTKPVWSLGYWGPVAQFVAWGPSRSRASLGPQDPAGYG